MKYFITLYDKGYLSRGIALYRSLDRECKENFRLFILALDKEVENFWENNPSSNITVITISELLEFYPVLRQIENERTHTEFCWTLSAFSIQYLLKKFNIPSCTYVDSDICFYDDPQKIINEMGDASVLITEHNYSSQYDFAVRSGKFCVQFMHFLNNQEGNEILEWWRLKCEESCTIDFEKGLCGDQKYLDDWESRFEGKVYNCRSQGCGVAPWNLQKYCLLLENGKYYIVDKISKVKKPIIFFHYHGLLKLSEKIWRMSGYKTGKDFEQLLYRDYIYQLIDIENELVKLERQACLNIQEIDMVRFQTIPYYGESRVEIEIVHDNNSSISVMKIEDKNTEEKGAIYFQKRNFKGQWISIKSVEGVSIITSNLHEIIWKLQYKECYSECQSINDAVYEIFRRKNAGEWMLTECPWELLEKRKIKHPAYEIRPVVRVYKEQENGMEYLDVLGSNVVRI